MTSDPQDLLPVTQADREAAAQVYDARPSDWSGASDQVRRGLHDDTAIVQAFARHRLSVTDPDVGRLRQALLDTRVALCGLQPALNVMARDVLDDIIADNIDAALRGPK